MTTYWAPLLHLYQPPWQDIKVLKLINKECYKPLLYVINEYDNVKFSLNINGVLIDLLYEYGLDDTMEILKNLVSENKIEILGTGMYHPILPLIPIKEIEHQIELNEEINKREFENWKKKGFFPPELAGNINITNYIQEMGYKWIIMSGIACMNEWPYDRIYKSINGLKIFFRDEIISNKIAFKSITPNEFIKEIKLLQNDKRHDSTKDTYVITALDGETFGHHIPNYEKTFLKKSLELINDNDDIKIVYISDLENNFPIAGEKIIPRESSWSTTQEDINKEIPYPLWNHPENQIHKYYWKMIRSMNNLISLADNIDLKKDGEINHYYFTARWFYDQSLHSCPMWWANSEKNIWSPNIIYKGIELLMKAALNAQIVLIYAGKLDLGEAYYDSIIYYQGLLLMELTNISKKMRKNSKIRND
jgi:alpha-amylase/alpha-mannosidase (GH57 family)